MLFTIAAIGLGTLLYFFMSMMLGFIGFWSADVWAPRFLSFVVIDFFAGGLFPLDILPTPFFIFSQFLPFHYFIYFPLKVYLGQVSYPNMINGFFVGLCWLIALRLLTYYVWQRGLRFYAAEGR